MADYATVEELQIYMGDSVTDETIMAMMITAASAVIDQYTDNPFEADEIPAGIKAACLLQAARFVERKDAVFGIVGAPDMPGESRLLAKIDVDVQVTCRPFKRWWGAVGGSDGS